jgi:hypothetical protein
LCKNLGCLGKNLGKVSKNALIFIYHLVIFYGNFYRTSSPCGCLLSEPAEGSNGAIMVIEPAEMTIGFQ